uniref:Uncharacterized protein n=1 Tax=viral metagenome TaxID=1070528 RepID=A0A6C0IJF2_9ZZZZ
MIATNETGMWNPWFIALKRFDHTGIMFFYKLKKVH